MINLRNAFFTLAVVGLGAVSLPKAANAFTVVDRTGFTDTEFENLRTTGQFTELFVAESRIGNDSLDTTERELGINDAKGTPLTTGEFAWGNNQPVDFQLQYTGSLVNYIVGGQLLSSSAFSGPVTDIFFRTKSAANSIMQLSNLVFEGTGIGNLSSSGNDVDYLQISNITAPFTLTGKSLMSWTGTQPKRSNLAYQIKVGNTAAPVESVPEPGTVGALLAAGVLSIGLKKKQKLA